MLEISFDIIWTILQLYIWLNLVLPIALLVLYGFSKFKNESSNLASIAPADYAIVVTAYEQTNLLNGVVNSLLQLNYSNYIIYIVADKCDITNLFFNDQRVVLLRPTETLASNTRSHFYAIKHFKRNHDRITIIDSDNFVHPEYLNELNLYFHKGFNAIQGYRSAKNLNTMYAALDAARDIYYHFYDGKVLFTVGSSATLAGSGMAFTLQLYKDCLGHLDIEGAGFDKILQKQIVDKGYRIAFAERAIVYDEKTAHADQLVKQRARWINTWFKYFSYGFGLIRKGIIRFNWNQFLFGLILLRPPLFIFLLLSLVFLLINLFLNSVLVLIWLIGIGLFIIGFFLSLLLNNADQKIYKSLWGIPKFIFLQVLSLLKVRNANKHSVATKH